MADIPDFPPIKSRCGFALQAFYEACEESKEKVDSRIAPLYTQLHRANCLTACKFVLKYCSYEESSNIYKHSKLTSGLKS